MSMHSLQVHLGSAVSKNKDHATYQIVHRGSFGFGWKKLDVAQKVPEIHSEDSIEPKEQNDKVNGTKISHPNTWGFMLIRRFIYIFIIYIFINFYIYITQVYVFYCGT